MTALLQVLNDHILTIIKSFQMTMKVIQWDTKPGATSGASGACCCVHGNFFLQSSSIIKTAQRAASESTQNDKKA